MIDVTRDGHRPVSAPPSATPRPRVAVLLSQRLASLGRGLDLALLRSWLQTALPGVDAHAVSSLAKQPDEIARLVAASGAERLVLGLAPGEYLAAEFQAQARKAGLDPLGVVVLNLGTHAALVDAEPASAERVKLLFAAAIARARAFPGSRPEHLKASVSVAVSRRALFTLAVHEYQAVPALVPGRCAADRGCRVCVDNCPRDALRLLGQQVELSKARCESCGVCVSACPTEALAFPGHSSAELDAEITTLLDPMLGDLEPRGILFVCRQSAPMLEAAIDQGFRYPAGWLPVSVPCAGAISPALMLSCLALGAAGVGVAACREQCRFTQGSTVAERVALCQEFLRLIGAPPERVKFCPVGSGDAVAWALPAPTGGLPAYRPAGTASGDRHAAARAILHLAQAHGAPDDVVLAHAQSPFGLVELDVGGCTACEACTSACPTGALAADREADAVSITFDTALCTACGVCVPRCPEADRDVLRVDRALDLHRLRAGRVALYRDEAARCVACGAPVAPAGMMARLAELLGDQYAALAPTISRYCSDCRGAPPVPPRDGERC